MLPEQVIKLNCEKCQLRTEHYVQIREGNVLVCRCLRCGHPKKKLVEDERSYSPDDRRPVYVS